ncbi:hypothetical protein ACJX0J_026464, partial [Zea mays]
QPASSSSSPAAPARVVVSGRCCCCMKRLLEDRDIFIYLGKKAFCSDECRNGFTMDRLARIELRNGLAGACYARPRASEIASAGGRGGLRGYSAGCSGGSGATSPSATRVLQLRVCVDRRDRVEAAGERHRRRSVLSHLPRR